MVLNMDMIFSRCYKFMSLLVSKVTCFNFILKSGLSAAYKSVWEKANFYSVHFMLLFFRVVSLSVLPNAWPSESALIHKPGC